MGLKDEKSTVSLVSEDHWSSCWTVAREMAASKTRVLEKNRGGQAPAVRQRDGRAAVDMDLRQDR